MKFSEEHQTKQVCTYNVTHACLPIFAFLVAQSLLASSSLTPSVCLLVVPRPSLLPALEGPARPPAASGGAAEPPVPLRALDDLVASVVALSCEELLRSRERTALLSIPALAGAELCCITQVSIDASYINNHPIKCIYPELWHDIARESTEIEKKSEKLMHVTSE